MSTLGRACGGQRGALGPSCAHPRPACLRRGHGAPFRTEDRGRHPRSSPETGGLPAWAGACRTLAATLNPCLPGGSSGEGDAGVRGESPRARGPEAELGECAQARQPGPARQLRAAGGVGQWVWAACTWAAGVLFLTGPLSSKKRMCRIAPIHAPGVWGLERPVSYPGPQAS